MLKYRIHAVSASEIGSVMACNREICYVTNTLKKIHLSRNIFNEFTSTYYYEKNDGFEFLFKKYTENSVNNIYHSYLIQ